MSKKSRNTVSIEREERDLEVILLAMPDNPIAWDAVIRMVAPLLARLAVRYALRKSKRGLSEERITSIAGLVTDRIATIVARRTGATSN